MSKIALAAVLTLSLFLQGCTKKTPENQIATQVENVQTQQQTTDIKASFAIFTNGTFRIFTAAMYHNQSQDAYIDAPNPNTVIVKKANTTWDDFFKTLPFEITNECLTTGTGQKFCSGQSGELKFYLNGTLQQNALTTKIKSGDKLLVTFGSETEAQIQDQITKIPNAD